jgi:hypothetical protein
MSWVQLSDQAAPYSLRRELQTGNTSSFECLFDALAEGITAVQGRSPITTLLPSPCSVQHATYVGR